MKSDKLSVQTNLNQSATDAILATQDVFSLKYHAFEGFDEGFATLMDDSVPKMTESMKNSENTIDQMSKKWTQTKMKFDKITYARHPELISSK